jgi:hypothetical protein
MRKKKQRGRYVIEVTAPGNRERDIVLATHDGEAAGDAIIALAEALHGANVATIATFLISEAETLENHSRDRGSNLHLVALIALRSRLVALASSDDERGRAHDNLGIALWTLGERENGTARLEQAVVAFRAALEELTRGSGAGHAPTPIADAPTLAPTLPSHSPADRPTGPNPRPVAPASTIAA